MRWQASYHTQSAKQIIFDSGASVTISPHAEDFIELDTSEEAIRNLSVHAVNSRVPVKGVGTVNLVVHTDNESVRYIKTKAFWCPNANVTLFSVIRYCHETKDGAKFLCDDNGVAFHFTWLSGGGITTFHAPSQGHFVPSTNYNIQTNKRNKSQTKSHVFNVVDTTNINLSRSSSILDKT